MKPIALAKLAVAGLGIVAFALGIRYESSTFRWTGIGLVAAAWLLRFAKKKPVD